MNIISFIIPKIGQWKECRILDFLEKKNFKPSEVNFDINTNDQERINGIPLFVKKRKMSRLLFFFAL